MSVREDLIAKLDRLTDEQIAKVLRDVETMTEKLPDDYNEEDDPIVGMFSNPGYTNLASNAKAILYPQIRHNDYDPSKDPMIDGLFDGPPDLADRSTEILRAEFGIKKEQEDKPE